MNFDMITDYVYTFLFLPIVVLFQRQFNVKSRVSVLESKIIKLDKIDTMAKDISYIKGVIDTIHLKDN